MLVRGALPLAICELALPDRLEVVDLDDPAVLTAERLRPSRVATRERSVTQRIAIELFERHPKAAAFAWWSTLEASWRNVTVLDRSRASLTLERADELTPDHALVRDAAAFLALEI